MGDLWRRENCRSGLGLDRDFAFGLTGKETVARVVRRELAKEFWARELHFGKFFFDCDFFSRRDWQSPVRSLASAPR